MKKTKIKKQTFIEAIESIDKLHKKNMEFAEKMSKCFPNTRSVDFISDNDFVTNSLISVLQELFNDKNANSWIEYFCWELDFGRENWRLKANENGKEIQLSNAGQLFDYLNR